MSADPPLDMAVVAAYILHMKNVLTLLEPTRPLARGGIQFAV